MLQIAQPFQNFVDLGGLPLDNGYVYIGTANQNPETNAIAVYWDAALTIQAAQPIRTVSGYMARNGSPARLYANVSAYSITVRDKNSALVISASDASTFDDLSSPFNHLSTGNFFSDSGARVDRLADRLFVGNATTHTGADVVSQSDWLTTYELARGRAGGSLMFSTAGITNDSGTKAANTLMVGAQATNLLTGYNAIAVRTLAANNSTLSTVHAYGGYFEAYRNSTANGGAYGIELDTINYASVVQVDPYQQLAGQTIALQIAGGGEYPAAGQFASSAAINIRKNGSTYERGIVFGSDSLTGATGSSGTAPAIVMGSGHGILWYGASGVSSSAIYCTGTTTVAGTTQTFTDTGVSFGNSSSSKTQFFIENIGITSVNYATATPSATGNPVQFKALGDDANIDVQLVPKGTGAVWLGAWTTNADAAVNGYVTVKDSAGTIRKLATIA